MAREHEAREPEREEGGVLYDGVHVRVREEVLQPGGVVRFLAGAPVEVEAHTVERLLVGAPLERQRRGHGGAGGGEAPEHGDVLERDGGLAPGEDEGVCAGGPEGGEVEDGGGVPLEPVGGGEDGVEDPEFPPEALVDRAQLGDPEVPVARGAEPAPEGDAELGGGGGGGRRRRAERGRARDAGERGEHVGQAALPGAAVRVHVHGELLDEKELVRGGHGDGDAGGAPYKIPFSLFVGV